jgi:hypothetical protein
MTNESYLTAEKQKQIFESIPEYEKTDFFETVVAPSIPILLDNLKVRTILEFRPYLRLNLSAVVDPIKDRFRNTTSLLRFDDTAVIYDAIGTWAYRTGHDEKWFRELCFAVLRRCLRDDNLGLKELTLEERRSLILAAWKANVDSDWLTRRFLEGLRASRGLKDRSLSH